MINPLHHPAKAKRVIWLTMAGGPSHLETLDYKPELAKMDGQPMPESFTKGQQIAQLQGQKAGLLRPANQVQKVRLPTAPRSANGSADRLGVDDICFVRSMTTEAINHDPAHMFMNTGSQIAGRPRMGSWVDLRPGQRSRGSARLRRAHVARPRRPEPADRRPAMVVAAFCRAVTRACTSAARETRCSIWRSPPGVGREQQQDVVQRGQCAQSRDTTPCCTIRKSPRGSPSTKWPSGCRPACRS